jgi:uncharacterized protein (TIRG00374 family)
VTSFTRRLVLALLLGVAVYAGFAVFVGWSTLGGALAGFAWSALGGALMLSTANYGLRFLKWQYYLRALEVRGVPPMESLLVFLSGFVLTVTPGKVGEVFKSAVLRRTHGVDAVLTAPIVVAERLTDVIAIVVLVVVGSLSFSGGVLWAGLGAAAVAAVLVVLAWEWPLDALFRGLERRGGRLALVLPRLRTARSSLERLTGPRRLLVPTALSLVGWAAEGLGLYWLLWGFSTPIDLARAEFFYATSTLAGALVPVPGGLGVTEAMFQSQLVELGGVPLPAATGAMLLIRFATLWWAVLVGFASLGLLRLRFPKLLQGGV